jgi:hypothetical protein
LGEKKMNKLDVYVVIFIYTITMAGILYLANKLGETENRLNYICGEVQELDLLSIDKKGVCGIMEQ